MRAPQLRWLARVALLAAALAVLPPAIACAAGRADTAKELDAIQNRIRGLEKEIGRAAASKPTAGKALKQAEVIEAEAREELGEVRRQLAEGRERERTLRSEVTRAQTELAQHRQTLESQLRLAYVSGREEWLRLALSQRDPAALTRRIVHYGYITRQRGALLQQVESELAALEAAGQALNEQLAALAELSRRQEARLAEVSAARRVRARAVQTIERDLGSRKDKLARLRREARGLSDLMARLERESRAPQRKAAQLADTGPAQQVKGLPLKGRMVARYGQPRADGLLRWDGMVLEAPAGTEVKAVRGGRVVYADWLPGMGQLVVVDHGKGLMSLYGHNQDVLKKSGESVRQGEAIARVGDSGGQGRPGLYFEMRRNGKPVNPGEWVR